MRDDVRLIDDVIDMIDVNICDSVVISGGEPCAQPKPLIEITRRIKEELNMDVAVETNGTFPEVIDDISPYVDQFFVDFKSDPFNYNRDLLGMSQVDFDNYFRTLDLIESLRVPLELRTTCFSNLIDELTIHHMGDFIDSSFYYEPTWVLQQGHVDDVLDNLLFDETVVYSYDDMKELGNIGREYVEDMYIHTFNKGRELVE
jgi:pyruvate-formate lyase-activating enzyme